MDFSAEYELGVGTLGIKPSEFWSLTLSELLIMAEGYNRKTKRRSNELISLAWHTEAFARLKKLPSLKSLIKDEDGMAQHREQTDEEMMAMASMLNAAFGGEVVEI